MRNGCAVTELTSETGAPPPRAGNGQSGATLSVTGNARITTSALARGVFKGLSIFADLWVRKLDFAVWVTPEFERVARGHKSALPAGFEPAHTV